MRRKYPKPKIGDRYGEWTVLFVPIGTNAHTKIPCRCSCGRVIPVLIDSLVREVSTRCRSCAGRQTSKTGWAVRYAKGLPYDFIPIEHRQRLKDCIYHAVYRCCNPRNMRYKNYGGRGISVYSAWRKDYTLFAAYLMTLDGWSNPDLTIDRIDNDGDYEPGNLRWVTTTANNQNKSRRSA